MQPSDKQHRQPRGFGVKPARGVLVLFVVIGVLAGLWAARVWLFSSKIKPVVLSVAEQERLDDKLRVLGKGPSDPDETDGALRPEPYAERPEDRVIFFTQRELNALIARNPDLAERTALHMSEDMLSAVVLITIPQDVPIISGKTLKVATGLRLRHEHGRPVVVVEGVSVMGVPLPASWLGGVKGRDLIAVYADKGGFWQAFSEGIRDLRIEQGRLRVELAE